MRKNLGVCPAIFPMPVLMIATYDKEGNVDVMNAAWGMMLETNKIVLNLSEGHKTVKNIQEMGAFTVSIADSLHVIEADYVGMVSGNIEKHKFLNSGLTEEKSGFVNAPMIKEFPITMECKFIEYQRGENGCGVVGEILNVSADEKVLDENGKVDVTKINAIMYDPFHHGYYEVGKKVGQAFSDGKRIKGE